MVPQLIYLRGLIIIIQKMIISILQNKIKPIPQKGKVTIFKRRKPHQSNIIEVRNPTKSLRLY